MEAYRAERSARLAAERQVRKEQEEDRRALRGYRVAWAPDRRELAGVPPPAPRALRPLALPAPVPSYDPTPTPGGGRAKGFFSFKGEGARAFSGASNIHDQWARSGLGKAGALPSAQVLLPSGFLLGAIERDTWEKGPRAIARAVRAMLRDEDYPEDQNVIFHIEPGDWGYPE